MTDKWKHPLGTDPYNTHSTSSLSQTSSPTPLNTHPCEPGCGGACHCRECLRGGSVSCWLRPEPCVGHCPVVVVKVKVVVVKMVVKVVVEKVVTKKAITREENKENLVRQVNFAQLHLNQQLRQDVVHLDFAHP